MYRGRARTKTWRSSMAIQSSVDIKARVLEAFDTLFNKRDYARAAEFWSESYIQHSAHIPPGRDGLFNLVRSAPPELRYENHTIAVDGRFCASTWTVYGKWPPSRLDCG